MQWRQESSFTVGHVPVQVYRSEKTGMKAMFAQVPAPCLSVYVREFTPEGVHRVGYWSVAVYAQSETRLHLSF